MTKRYDPVRLLPPHRVTRPEQVDELTDDMLARGWCDDELIGYRKYVQTGPIQLLSGTHRHAAASRAGIQIPVIVYNRATVERAYGDLEKWYWLMRGELDDLC